MTDHTPAPPPKAQTTTPPLPPKPKNESFKAAFSRLLALAYPDRTSFAFAVGALCISSLSNLLLPTVLGLAVDRVSGGGAGHSSSTLAVGDARSSLSVLRNLKDLTDAQFFLGCLGVFGVGSLASWFRTYTVGTITENIAMRLRYQIYASVLWQDLAKQDAETRPLNHTTAAIAHEGGSGEAFSSDQNGSTNNTNEDGNEDGNKDGNTNERQDAAAAASNLQAFDIVQALSVESDVLAGAVTKVLTNFLRGLNSTLGGSIMLLTLSPKLTVASISVVPLIGVTAMVSRMRTRKQAKEVAKELSTVNGRADERLKHLSTVKMFGREEYELQEYLHLIKKIKKMRSKVAMSDGIFMGALNMAFTSSMLGVLCFGGWLVKRGELTGGKLTAFMSYTLMLGAGSSMLAGIRQKTVSAVAAADNVFCLLDNKNSNNNNNDDDDDNDDNVDNVNKVNSDGTQNTTTNTTTATTQTTEKEYSNIFHSGDIIFHNVSFKYPYSIGENGETSKCILNGLQLKIRHGEKTALVGPSGAGKSTVLALLLRLYDVNEGTITIGGMNIQEIPKELLLQKIGIVNQRPILWNISIKENIRYGRLDATDEEIDQALMDVNLESFVQSLPNGSDTIVGEDGNVRMSGGQLARIAIARAMIKKPSILILDEATSSLDSVSENKVSQALETLMMNKTTLVVGHSVDAIRDSKTCFVLENGQISEEGPLNVLLQQNQESRLQKYVNSNSFQ